MRSLIVFILGPTSSGKSAVAARLAEKAGGEVISCDSMQVYKGMGIITQAPGSELLSRAPHHLIGAVPPEEEYSAARFSREAGEAVKKIMSRGNIPVVAGGTGLYVRALVDGLFESPAKDEELRRSLKELAALKGPSYLHDKLQRIDPATAEKLHVNDMRRIIRALEVYELTGSTMSEKKAATRGISDDHDCGMFALRLERPVLYSRIDRTVGAMFERGVVEEVKRLKQKQLSLTAEKALGVKEISALLEGRATEDQAREELKKNTRNYAKRQLTWFRADKRITWIDADRPAEEIAEDILKLIEGGAVSSK